MSKCHQCDRLKAEVRLLRDALKSITQIPEGVAYEDYPLAQVEDMYKEAKQALEKTSDS